MQIRGCSALQSQSQLAKDGNQNIKIENMQLNYSYGTSDDT